VLHKTLALSYAHGRIHDAEGERGFVVGIKNKNTSCSEDAVLAGNTCRFAGMPCRLFRNAMPATAEPYADGSGKLHLHAKK
jgi:hypothetical protein